jgi:3-phosphoshikimate 1-carboxyvinyltransferase
MLIGDASRTGRPMGALADALGQLGAIVATTGEARTPPLVLRRTAPLRGTTISPARPSAQTTSAVLLAALGAEGETRVLERRLTRDHTERLLPAFGIQCARAGRATNLTGPAEPRATTIEVPGDFSAAFFWLVAGSIAESGRLVVRGVGVNPTRTGALAVLRRLGARISESSPRLVGDVPVADLTVEPADLEATDVRASEIPSLIDELPALAIAQAAARGRSTVRGAGDLRFKESDRIEAVVNALQALSGTAHETPDGWTVEGGALSGGTIESHGDHRLAMAFGVASLRATGPVRILGSEMIDTSYPAFYHAFKDRVQER